jgi:hypothetical protein
MHKKTYNIILIIRKTNDALGELYVVKSSKQKKVTSCWKVDRQTMWDKGSSCTWPVVRLSRSPLFVALSKALKLATRSWSCFWSCSWSWSSPLVLLGLSPGLGFDLVLLGLGFVLVLTFVVLVFVLVLKQDEQTEKRNQEGCETEEGRRGVLAPIGWCDL